MLCKKEVLRFFLGGGGYISDRKEHKLEFSILILLEEKLKPVNQTKVNQIPHHHMMCGIKFNQALQHTEWIFFHRSLLISFN